MNNRSKRYFLNIKSRHYKNVLRFPVPKNMDWRDSSNSPEILNFEIKYNGFHSEGNVAEYNLSEFSKSLESVESFKDAYPRFGRVVDYPMPVSALHIIDEMREAHEKAVNDILFAPLLSPEKYKELSHT